MVRRAYDLYPRVYAFENLLLAERTAARGKRKRPDVAAFEYHLEDELVRLQEELRTRTYRHGPYRRYTVREPKERIIAAAPYRDRVVHHALCRVIEPLFERRFIPDSYASRLGKGTHAALDRCTHFARQFRFVLRARTPRSRPPRSNHCGCAARATSAPSAATRRRGSGPR